MRTGYCGPDANAAMHAKCTQPDRCTCPCHDDESPAPEPIEELPVPAYTCDGCGESFPSPQGLGAHRRHNPSHRADPPPIKIPPRAERDQSKNDLFRVTGLYGGLFIDLTVSTGDRPIDPAVLSAVIALTNTLETP